MSESDWDLVITADALKDLKRADSAVSRRILAKLEWLSANFNDVHSEALAGSFRGLHKLRIGDWRAIYEVDDAHLILVVHTVRHRSDVYR